jgi:hypothetical protein
MKELNNNYISKLNGFSEEVEGLEMNFKDCSLEQRFRKSIIGKSLTLSKIFFTFECFEYIIVTFICLRNNKFKLARNVIISIVGFVLELMLVIFSHCYLKNKYRLLIYLKWLRFFFLYFISANLILLPFTTNTSIDILVKYTYGFMLCMSYIYLCCLDFNYILLFTFPIINVLLLVFIQFWKELPEGYLFLDIAFNFISSCTI